MQSREKEPPKLFSVLRQKSLYSDCHSGLDPESREKVSFRRKPESRVFEGLWMPPYHVRGRLLRSGMTD